MYFCKWGANFLCRRICLISSQHVNQGVSLSVSLSFASCVYVSVYVRVCAYTCLLMWVSLSKMFTEKETNDVFCLHAFLSSSLSLSLSLNRHVFSMS